jgi:hypothetical protein
MSISGFESSLQGLQITKDTEAKLTYTLDWSQWLPTGDSLSAVVWTIGTRANDPDPLIKESFGIQGTKTYIQLSNGQVNKSYTVTAKITTNDGLIDRRSFRIKIQDRTA